MVTFANANSAGDSSGTRLANGRWAVLLVRLGLLKCNALRQETLIKALDLGSLPPDPDRDQRIMDMLRGNALLKTDIDAMIRETIRTMDSTIG